MSEDTRSFLQNVLSAGYICRFVVSLSQNAKGKTTIIFQFIVSSPFGAKTCRHENSINWPLIVIAFKCERRWHDNTTQIWRWYEDFYPPKVPTPYGEDTIKWVSCLRVFAFDFWRTKTRRHEMAEICRHMNIKWISKNKQKLTKHAIKLA
jgi:hypothetical protein